MRLVFLGPPGAGKGTQAEQLARDLKLPHISTGNILRQAIKVSTPTGLEAKSYVESGALVPFDIILRLVRDRVLQDDCRRGWILDGFPRNLDQAHALAALLVELKIAAPKVVYFQVRDEVLVRRLSGRRTCRNCQTPFHVEFSPPKSAGKCDRCGGTLDQRADDQEAAIRKRLVVYQTETVPLVAHYRSAGQLLTLSADGDPGQVSTELRSLLGIGVATS
ncbi:MAG: adenylate kinase [Planctomycetota bacterium]